MRERRIWLSCTEIELLMTRLPDATPSPCNECPWRREAEGGHLGPYSPLDWIKIAHSDTAIACHKTVVAVKNPLEGIGDWEHPKIRQCRGAAIFRENVQKNPRNQEVVTGPGDKESCFGTNEEFLEHHGDPDSMLPEDLYTPMSHEKGGKR